MNVHTHFWQQHLSSTAGPMFHFCAAETLDLPSLSIAVNNLGFELFPIHAEAIHSEEMLMEAFACTMQFPEYFGKNWDALLDLTRDLSWKASDGFVLVLENADAIAPAPYGLFRTLVEVMESTVREWRDERGEFNERTHAVPFHVIFFGSRGLKEALTSVLLEPLCEHIASDSVQITLSPPRLKGTETYRMAESLLTTGASLDLILSFLRERQISKRESTYIIAGLTGSTFGDARRIVDESKTWSDRYDRDENFRLAARRALDELGY